MNERTSCLPPWWKIGTPHPVPRSKFRARARLVKRSVPFSIPLTPSQMYILNTPSIISQRNLWPLARVGMQWEGQGRVKMFLVR